MEVKKTTEKSRVIIQAALELIADQGFHATPMAQVASHAGVGVGSIYRHFKDRDDLIHAIHRQYSESIKAALVEGYNPKASKKEQFFSLIALLADFFICHPLEFKFVDQYYNSPYGIAKKREEVISESINGSEETPFPDLLASEELKDLPVLVLNNLAFSPLVACVRDHLSGILLMNGELIESIAAASWDAISNNKGKTVCK